MHEQLEVPLSSSRHLHSFTVMALLRIYSDVLPRHHRITSIWLTFHKVLFLMCTVNFFAATKVENGILSCFGVQILLSFFLIKKKTGTGGEYSVHPLVHHWS